jgi:hypothetical protein
MINVTPGVPGPLASQTVTTTPPITNDFISTIGHYVFSVSPNPFSDLFGIFFFPKSGSMGLFFIVPVALLAVILCPLLVARWKNRKKPVLKNKEIVLFLLVASFSIILAYIHGLDGLNMSHGIGPDIRYLSPEYIPVLLLSLIVLEKTVLLAHPKELVKKLGLFGIFIVPVILASMIIIIPLWNRKTSNYFLFFDLLILAEVICIAAITIVYYVKQKEADSLSGSCLPVLILTIFSWQILMILLVSPVLKFNGYTFWIPGVDTLYHDFIRVTMLS